MQNEMGIQVKAQVANQVKCELRTQVVGQVRREVWDEVTDLLDMVQMISQVREQVRGGM